MDHPVWDIFDKSDTDYFIFWQAVSIVLIMAEFVRHEYRVRIN
jgi:hypothetical protein